MNNTEVWKVISEDCPNHEISNFGRVRHRIKKNILKLRYDDWGYAVVVLWRVGKPNKLVRVHREVGLKFVENKTNKTFRELQVNHLDGVKTNNHFTNLEWCTGSENMLHAVKHNLVKLPDQKGIKHSQSKLTEVQVKEIYSKAIAGVPHPTIASEYNISRGTVSKIKNKTRWKHILP